MSARVQWRASVGSMSHAFLDGSEKSMCGVWSQEDWKRTNLKICRCPRCKVKVEEWQKERGRW